MRYRVKSMQSLKKGGPYRGPKGGLYADPALTKPYKPAAGAKKAHGACKRCGGKGFLVSRQRNIFGAEDTSATPCALCNKGGKKKRVKGQQLPLFGGGREDVKKSEPLSKNLPVKYEVAVQGLRVAIENPKGSVRKWYDPEKKQHGQTVLVHPYGFIRGAKGADGEEVDAFVGPHRDSDKVFIVNQRQVKDLRRFDEHKVMLGFRTEEEARRAYLQNYDTKGPKMLGTIRTWTMDRFKRWLAHGDTSEPVAKAGG
jgi:hypothetical protein